MRKWYQWGRIETDEIVSTYASLVEQASIFGVSRPLAPRPRYATPLKSGKNRVHHPSAGCFSTSRHSISPNRQSSVSAILSDSKRPDTWTSRGVPTRR